jgi:hypothetical protein
MFALISNQIDDMFDNQRKSKDSNNIRVYKSKCLLFTKFSGKKDGRRQGEKDERQRETHFD